MDPSRLAIINYAQAVSDLAAPKKALKVLDDQVRLAAYVEAIDSVVADAAEWMRSVLHSFSPPAAAFYP